jgi:hypothetical protein
MPVSTGSSCAWHGVESVDSSQQNWHLVVFIYLFILRYWVLNSGPSPWATPPALFFVKGFFWDRLSRTIVPRLASNHNPPDLCLLSSKDYRDCRQSHWCLASVCFLKDNAALCRPRLASHSWSSCLSLQSAGIIGVNTMSSWELIS